MERKTAFNWFSSWRDGEEKPRFRKTECADVVLCVQDQEHLIEIDGELYKKSSWAYLQIDGHNFEALKMATVSPPKMLRYYCFMEVQMTRAGGQCYLCQHSSMAEENENHTVETYLAKFLEGGMKNEQTYHVSMVQVQI